MRIVKESEEELLIRLKSGNEVAFADLYALHIKKIYAYAISILKSPALAQDVVQDVFIKIWERAAEIRTDLSLLPFLYTLTRNQCLNTIRRASKESWITDEMEQFVLDGQEDGLAFTQRRQTSSYIAVAIADLPPQRKKIYELCHMQGYTYKQAAAVFGIKDSTVNSQMVKAIRSIKAYLIKNGALLSLLFLIS